MSTSPSEIEKFPHSETHTNVSSMLTSLSSSTGDIVTAVAFVIVLCFTVIGSVIVLLAIVRNTSSRLLPTTHCYVVSLACGNLLMAISVLPVRIVSFLDKPAWIKRSNLCEVYSTMVVLCCAVTVFSLAAMSVDRYFSIPRSGTYTKMVSPCRCFALIVVFWVLAAVLSLAPAQLGKTSRPLWDCKLRRVYNRPFIYCFVTIIVLIPVALMLALHCRIAKARTNHFRTVDISGRKIKNLDYSDLPTLSQESAWAQVVIKILGSFILFWIPRCIFLLLDNSHHSSMHEIADGVTEILTYCFGASLALLLANYCSDYKYEMALMLCPLMWYQRREHRSHYQVHHNSNKVQPGVTPSMMYRKYSTSSTKSFFPL